MSTVNKKSITSVMSNEIKKNQNKIIKKNPDDSRKQPAPGYLEKESDNKKNVQDFPENQNSG